MTTIFSLATDAGISRKYLRIAAMYRRCSTLPPEYMTFEHLKQQYAHETFGEPLPENLNGFSVGKKFLSVTVTDVIFDIRNGYSVKAEFYEGPAKWFWQQTLKNVIPGSFFASGWYRPQYKL